jgi:predicted TIM-barrel fold metal-dependent hydrolase
MTVPHGGYPAAWQVTQELVATLSPTDRAKVLAGTAVSVYGLEES